MRNFQDTFETRKRLFICAFSICILVPLITDVRSTKRTMVLFRFPFPYFIFKNMKSTYNRTIPRYYVLHF